MIFQVRSKLSSFSKANSTVLLSANFCWSLLAIAGFLSFFSASAIATVEPEIQRSSVHLAQNQSAQESAQKQAKQLLQQGSAYFQQRQWQQAEAFWQDALKLYRQVKDRAGEGRVLGN